jgi:bacterioferritin-associated ferredoxin
MCIQAIAAGVAQPLQKLNESVGLNRTCTKFVNPVRQNERRQFAGPSGYVAHAGDANTYACMCMQVADADAVQHQYAFRGSSSRIHMGTATEV